MRFNYLLRESQFHGGRLLADTNCRLWWKLGMLMLFGSAVAVIQVTVQRFLNQPTFLAQEKTVDATPQFPTVFICPEIIFQKYKIEEFLEKIKIPPSLNTSYIKSEIHQLAAFFSADVKVKVRDLENMEYLLEYNEMDLYTAGLMLTATCEETLIRCRWHHSLVNCSKLFHMELTGDGFCCVFNGHSLPRELAGYHEKVYINRFFGFSSGLILAVNQSQPHYDVDISYKWVALQTSQHFVESTVNGTPLSPGAEHWAAYNLQNFQIEETVSHLSTSLRRCRMGSEHLQFFPQYNRRYCVMECEMFRTLEMCDCVRQIHPRPTGVQYCRAHELSCAARAKGNTDDGKEFHSSAVRMMKVEAKRFVRTLVTYDSDACDCPLACDVATDYVKTSSFPLMDNAHPLDTFYDDLDFEKVTIVRAFMQSVAVKTNKRQPFFSNMDLFAQLGGVFNVFFGVSILTLLELGILCFHWLKSFTKSTVNHDLRGIASDVKVTEVRTKEKKKRYVKNVNTIT